MVLTSTIESVSNKLTAHSEMAMKVEQNMILLASPVLDITRQIETRKFSLAGERLMDNPHSSIVGLCSHTNQPK